MKSGFTYNNKAYTIFKTLEGLGIGESLVELEQWPNVGFLNSVLRDLYEDTGFDYNNYELKCLLSAADVSFRHELMCLSKVLDHPPVDMESGSYDLHRKVTEESYRNGKN